MPPPGGRLWEVVGGGDKGGIVVRTAQDKTSDLLPERLATGTLVRELQLVDDRLQYDVLLGSGPRSGWVSLKLQDGKQLMVEVPSKEWEVVGGKDKGGILVRTGQDLASPPAAERLSTGARVRQVALAGERLFYDRITGTGPATGWVSLAAGDKPLLAEARTLSLPSGLQPIVGRKVRVLGMPHAPSNVNIFKFMTTQLRKTLGDVAEWVFLEPPTAWAPKPGSTHPMEQDVDEFIKRIAKDKPLMQWYEYSYHLQKPFPEDWDVWEHVEECCEYIMRSIAEEGPIDVLVTYSAGAAMASMLVEWLRRRNEAVPWRLSVLFGQAYVDDKRYNFEEPSSLPTIYIAGGKLEEDYPYNVSRVSELYSNLLVLQHEEGHVFPKAPPHAQDIYNEIARNIRRHCGLPA